MTIFPRLTKAVLMFSLITSMMFINTEGYSQKPDTKLEIQTIASALQLIDLAYVDSVNMQKLVDNAIVQTLKELDPHSAFIPKDEIERMNEPLEGSFDGIGITFQLLNDTILVIAPVPGGPSEKLGIMSGDKIVKIDGKNATGEKINNQWVMDHLRGAKGTKVDVSIYRKGRKNLIDYTIERDKIPLNSIDATFMAAPQIGYIKLNRFAKTSNDEFAESLDKLKSQGMTKLILDLRGNSGGYLGSAVDLADEFLGFGKLIVYTQGLNSPRQDYFATPAGGFEKGDLIILIDEGSASASEIVSGAIQDWDRGLIVGRRSFGKGLVQRPFNLPDGSMIRLTTARYYTPTGRCIQRPYTEGTDAYYMDFVKRYKHGELEHSDSIKFPDSLKYFTPRGRVVYGGGGIMPDIFIPWDSTWYSDYYADLRRKGLVNQFVAEYVDANRQELNTKYPKLDDFIKNFKVDGDFLKPFFDNAEKEGVKFDEDGWKASGEVVRTQMKALIARNLWDINAYYQVMSVLDDGLIKAVNIMNDQSLFTRLKVG